MLSDTPALAAFGRHLRSPPLPAYQAPRADGHHRRFGRLYHAERAAIRPFVGDFIRTGRVGHARLRFGRANARIFLDGATILSFDFALSRHGHSSLLHQHCLKRGHFFAIAITSHAPNALPVGL